MKKMLLTALALLITGCAQQVYCSKQTGSSSTKGNHHPSFLRFWNWAEENCRCSQNLWRRRKYRKTETQQTFVNGLLGLLLFRHLYSAGSACVLLTIRMSCPSIWATHLHCSLIYSGFLQLFLHSDQPLSEVKQSCSAVSASRGGCIIHAGGGGGFTH